MFDRGLTILRIRGIPIKLHITLLLFLPYVVFAATSQFSAFAGSVGVPDEARRLPPMAWGAILAVALFVAILAHELAHSLVALRHGVRVRSITLMMLGGVSQLENDTHEHEAWMAFAGPLMSFGIALVSYGMYRLLPGSEVGIALLVFAFTNAVLGAFNLLPAFPMDGGRVLRGLLAGPLGRERATRVATGLGKVMAVLFGLFGLLSYNLILVFIAMFVYMGASAEQARSGTQSVVRGIPISLLMNDRLGDAYADETSTAVAERLLRNNLVGARVLDALAPAGSHRELGVVTAWDLAQPARHGEAPATVGTIMQTNLPRVHAADDASQSLEALTTGEANAVAVLDEGEHVIGLVTPAEVHRALALVGAIHGRPMPR